jgi:hypothetical protein
MKIIFILFITSFFTFHIAAQADSISKIGPKNGLNVLALKYFGIKFSKQQRNKIKDLEIEMIYLIDKEGKPELKEVNGVIAQDIIDSLYSKTTELSNFYSRIVNNAKVDYIYSIKLTFPRYVMNELDMINPMNNRIPKISDFEYITKSKSRFDTDFNIVLSNYLGSIHQHFGIGGGMNMSMTYTSKKSTIYGINMSVNFNKLESFLPNIPQNLQSNSVNSIFLGITLGKWYEKFNLQFQLNYYSMIFPIKKDKNSEPIPIFKGISSGFTFNYPIHIFKDEFSYFFGSPVISSHYINFFVGIRPLFNIQDIGSGVLCELGVGYKLGCFGIQDFKLKN